MELEDRVRGYACDAVGDCSLDRITAVSRFDAGDRHAVYKVSYLDPSDSTTDLVVRVSTDNDADACEQAQREATVLEKVQGIAAPLLYDFRCDSRWFDAPSMCMQFLPGQQREPTGAAPQDLEQLGAVMARIHDLPTDDLAALSTTNTTMATYLAERHEDILSKLPSLRDPLPAVVDDRVRGALSLVNQRLETAQGSPGFRTDETLVLLHGDPGAGNIIWTPQPVLIDWEYARLGDPADEVAYIFGQHGLAADQRGAFWRGYRSRTDPRRVEQVMDRVGAWEPLTLLGSALWWLERWSRRADAEAIGQIDPSAAKAPSYYIDHATRRLERLDQLLAG
jgi:aminoglycoside phosphotransferase (APT) family kinase protein